MNGNAWKQNKRSPNNGIIVPPASKPQNPVNGFAKLILYRKKPNQKRFNCLDFLCDRIDAD